MPTSVNAHMFHIKNRIGLNLFKVDVFYFGVAKEKECFSNMLMDG